MGTQLISAEKIVLLNKQTIAYVKRLLVQEFELLAIEQ